MNSIYKSIRLLQRRLNDFQIPSMVIGGIAVAIWGDPRLTRDADLKIMLDRDEAERLLAALEPGYESLLPDPREALARQAMVFVKDSTGLRLDLLLADTPYDVQAIHRRQEVEVEPGLALEICSPEDLIIYKLISTRSRDAEDARGVCQRQAASLDEDYLLDWLRQFEQALDDSTLVATFRQMRAS